MSILFGKNIYLACAAVTVAAGMAPGEDITVHLPASASVSTKTVQYTCDAAGSKIGVPSGAFEVEYINGGGNSLAIVPIGGKSLVFANVVSGSGARYVAQQYTWWDARGGATLYSDSISGKAQSACHPVNSK